jgi:hypothetical protein
VAKYAANKRAIAAKLTHRAGEFTHARGRPCAMRGSVPPGPSAPLPASNSTFSVTGRGPRRPRTGHALRRSLIRRGGPPTGLRPSVLVVRVHRECPAAVNVYNSASRRDLPERAALWPVIHQRRPPAQVRPGGLEASLRPIIALVVAAASVLSGCAQQHTCQIHHDPLRADVVPIVYGWPTGIYGMDVYEAREHVFPNANRQVMGGCVTGTNDPKQTRVLYCESCRRAESGYATAVENSKSSWKGNPVDTPDVCPIHGVAFITGTFGVLDSTAEYPPGYFETRDGSFRFARTVYECPRQWWSGIRAATIEYCPECRSVEKEFLTLHQWKWEGMVDSTTVASSSSP